MTTLRQLVTNAYRETGLIALGETPDSDAFDEGLDMLEKIIGTFIGQEIGELLTDVYLEDVDEFYGITPNTRIILNNTAAVSLKLPEYPEDGARFSIVDNLGNLATYPVTIDPNGRRIEDATTLVLNTDRTNTEWFYRADLSNWVKVTELDANSSSPFPEIYDYLLSIQLNTRLNPRFGGTTTPEVRFEYSRLMKRFKAQYTQTRPRVLSEFTYMRLGPYNLRNNAGWYGPSNNGWATGKWWI